MCDQHSRTLEPWSGSPEISLLKMLSAPLSLFTIIYIMCWEIQLKFIFVYT